MSDTVREAAKAEMLRRGLSARALAQNLGIRPETVLDFVEDRRGTTTAVRILICSHLGLDPKTAQKVEAQSA